MNIPALLAIEVYLLLYLESLSKAMDPAAMALAASKQQGRGALR